MTTECRSFGIVSNTNVSQVASLLRGLCTQYAAMEVYEVYIKMPVQGGANSTRIRLSNKRFKSGDHVDNPFAAKQDDRWLLQHEGLPLTGAAVVDLPAAVRELTESHCSCSGSVQPPDFWVALGGSIEHEVVRRGNEYLCIHNGHEIKVQLVQQLALLETGKPESVDRNPIGRFVLDVVTLVPEGRHAEGAEVIAAFANKLQPLATLQRAAMPR